MYYIRVIEGKNMIYKTGFTLSETLIIIGIIGVVSALTVPALIQNYKRHIVETRLKYSYSLLTQAVTKAQAEYGDISNWDWEKPQADSEYLANILYSDNFTDKYIFPYIKAEKIKQRSTYNVTPIQLANGTIWKIMLFNPGLLNRPIALVIIDIDGSKGKNQGGIDIFYFSIVPKQASYYNVGAGDTVKNVPNGGVYYDGYGYSDTTLTNSGYRGCGVEGSNGAYCTALIINNGFKIPNNYPLKF